MAKQPFKLHSDPEKLRSLGRKDEIEELTSNLLGGVHTVVTCPPAYGKSLLLNKACEVLNVVNTIRVVRLELFSANNWRLFLEEYVNASLDAFYPDSAKKKKAAARYFQQSEVHFKGAQNDRVIFNWEPRDRAVKIDELLDLPEKLAKKKKVQLILVVDEFHELRSWPNWIESIRQLRRHWSAHKHVSYCLFGNKRQWMLQQFTQRTGFFRGFAKAIELDKIPEKHWVKYLTKEFRNSGKDISKDVAAQLVQTVDAHPWYIQQLAHYTWESSKNKVTEKSLNKGVHRMLAANRAFFEAKVRSLNFTQVQMLRAILDGARYLTGKETMRYYQLGTPRNAQKARDRLVYDDHIEKRGDLYYLLDVGFAMWFEDRMMEHV